MSSKKITLFVFSLLCAYSSTQRLDVDYSHLPKQGICESIDIRGRLEHMEKLRNCSVIAGNLRIYLLFGELNEKHVYPALREVTDYVLLHQPNGLESIGSMFPNLALIRGQILFYNYALVVFDAPHLQNIGLKSLMTIQRGFVRIDHNPLLCFVRTVNWIKISGRDRGHNFFNNGYPSCPDLRNCTRCKSRHCWNLEQCQIYPSEDCHEQCLGGCSSKDKNICFRCKNYMDDNLCVESCPPGKFAHPSTFQCVTEDMCKQLYKGAGWTWNNLCISDCPIGYMLKNESEANECLYCGDYCNVTCDGVEIGGFAEAQLLKGCNIIKGSLQIKFSGDNHAEDVMQELEDNLKDIQEIHGYLKVYRSASITTLGFLKNLKIIHGKELLHDRYSLIIHEMNNLQTLWNETQTKSLSIKEGTLFVHYNAKLCLKIIDDFGKSLNLTYNEDDVCRKSNGYQQHCHSSFINTTSKVIGPHGATIIWDGLPNTAKGQDATIEYSVYYLEEPELNVTTHYARDTCYDRGWEYVLFNGLNEGSNVMYLNLTNLKAYTKYAFYVETYYKSFSMTSDNLLDGQSLIQYFTTEMEHPPQPINLYAYSGASDELTLIWDDSPSFKGAITRYRVEFVFKMDAKELLDRRDYCQHPPKYDNRTPVRVAEVLKNEVKYNNKDRPRSCSCDPKQELEDILKDIRAEEDAKREKNVQRCFEIIKSGPPKNLDELIDHLECYNINYSIVDEDEPIEDVIGSRKKRDLNHPFDIHKILDIEPTLKPTKENVSHGDIYHRFSTFLEGEHKNFTINNLKHFGKYVITIEACKGPKDEDCGSYSMISLRTVPRTAADDIESITVVMLNETLVEVSWREPNDSNGAILSYDLEYRRIDIKDAKVMTECISRKSHEDNNWKYLLKIDPGKYGIRVRAKSLAQAGSFSKEYVLDLETSSAIGWVIFLIICILISTSVSGYIIWRNRQNNANTADTEVLVPVRRARYRVRGRRQRVTFDNFDD